MANDRSDREIEAAVQAERDRCVAILQRAREGEIDTDLRALIHRIENSVPREEK